MNTINKKSCAVLQWENKNENEYTEKQEDYYDQIRHTDFKRSEISSNP